MWIVAGIALINPTSFLLETTLTPQCHWGNQPGGRSALEKRHTSEVTSHQSSPVYLLLPPHHVLGCPVSCSRLLNAAVDLQAGGREGDSDVTRQDCWDPGQFLHSVAKASFH